MYFPRLPSPCSLSSINISTFRMKQIYLTFKGMIFSFQNKKACEYQIWVPETLVEDDPVSQTFLPRFQFMPRGPEQRSGCGGSLWL